MKIVCPNDKYPNQDFTEEPFHKHFRVSVEVRQTWRVDSQGERERLHSSEVEIIKSHDKDSSYVCCTCDTLAKVVEE